MKFLVVGAGVMGSMYAARLRRAGHEVAILARGQRAADLRSRGIVLEEAPVHTPVTTRVDVVERLEPAARYDVVLVAVRNEQLDGVLPVLAVPVAPTVLFMTNNALGPEKLIQVVGRERVLLGFPGAGGTREGDVVRYHILPAWQQPTTLGELDDQRTPRLEQIAAAFQQAGFPVAMSSRMDAWLKTHVMWTCPAAHALYLVGGSNYTLAHTRDGLVLWVRAVREGYQVLRMLGVPITPLSLRVFEVVPEPVLVAVLGRLLDTATAELVIARHARAARAEYVQLGDQFLLLARRAGVSTPAFERLRPYVDPSVPPIEAGSARLPLQWSDVGPWLSALAGVAAIAVSLRRCSSAGRREWIG